ncbi:uncharacterized protein LOC131673324 [Phymastichus coffea]|uniref:uncharacterized protein LOC131673324 n=1 Tax=Phymastichus coffea TaxID=108790 RepID=UPI00273B59E6|nr:uncharacterized protein LOC131673324 [Phymastichus coffea]
MKPFLRQQISDEHAVQNKKLDGILRRIESLEKEMMSNFERLLIDIDKVADETSTQNTASKFESYMQAINKTFEDLVSKKKKVNRYELNLDNHFKSDIDYYKNQLDTYKTKLEVILQDKEISLDFLEKLKSKANVCADKMTQIQLLAGFQALYVDTVSRYLIGKHIVISLWESADRMRHYDKKRELNYNVRNDLIKYTRRFRHLMNTSSGEFQLCGKPSSEYFIHSLADRTRNCYQTEEMSDNFYKIISHTTSRRRCWDYLSLRPATARYGYVVLGAKIERNANILYLKVIEGRLLADGIIDPTSIVYNEGGEPEIGEQVVKLDYRDTIFDITETITPNDRIITGLKFERTDDMRLYLAVQSTWFDLDEDALIASSTRTEPHQKGLTQFKVRSHDHRNDPIIKNDIGLQLMNESYFLKFEMGGKLQMHPAFDLSEIFPTPLTLLSGASLYVREVEGTQGYLSIRLHIFNVMPRSAKIDFEVNDDFSDVLNNI